MTTTMRETMSNVTTNLAQVRADLQARIADGERAATTLAALDAVYGTGKHYGNGEPDAELAEAAGLTLRPRWSRPDKWREFLRLRRDGTSFPRACERLKLHRDTAARLEKLV